MAGETDQRPSSGAEIAPVPDLIERYRSRRDAWIAQADELARMRDQVRGSAEREATDIVARARRNVQQVVMDARRELMVLSAQVQAALGEAPGKPDAAALLEKAGVVTGQADRASLGAAPQPALVPESAVDDILSEVHADMAALADEVRALPLEPVPAAAVTTRPAAAVTSVPVATAAPAVPSSPVAQTVAEPTIDVPWSSTPLTRSSPTAAAADTSFARPPFYETSALSDGAARALLSSPFPSEAVRVPSSRSFRTYVSFLTAIGIVVALVTLWWLRKPASPEPPAEVTAAAASSGSAEAVAAADGAPPSGAVAAPAPANVSSTTAARNLSVVAEAVRDVWVRTTVDGQSDLGRTLVAGQTLEVVADESIALRVGDGGALLVSVNQGEKEPLGRTGQVMTRRFVAEGARAPTPRRPLVPATEPPGPAQGAPPPPTVSAQPDARLPQAQTASAQPAPRLPSPAPAPPVGVVTAPADVAPAPLQVAREVPPPAPAARPEATAPATASPATAVVAAARRWLDAYHRQDRATMAALATDNMLLTDERRSEERLPPGVDNVTRTLDRVSVQIAADTAVLTAVMTEQSEAAPGPRVSPVSQVLVLGGDGQWKVRQVRFVSDTRLNQVFR